MQLYLIGSKRILCNIAIMKSEKDNPLKEFWGYNWLYPKMKFIKNIIKK